MWSNNWVKCLRRWSWGGVILEKPGRRQILFEEIEMNFLYKFSVSHRTKWIQVFLCLTQNQVNSSVFLTHTESNEFKCFSDSHRIKWIQVFFCLTQNQVNSSVFLTHTESNEFKCFSVSHRIKWIQVFSASRRIKWIQVFFWLLQVFWLANLNKFKRFFCFYKFASFDYHWLIYLIGNIP